MTAQRGSPPLVMRFLPLAVLLAAGVITLAACASGGGGQLLPPAPEPAVSLRASLSFGPVPEGTTSAPMTVTLTNVGSASLTFTSNPGLSGANAADFAITAATCSTASQVAAGANCTVTLTFKPSTAAGESASLGFADNASPSSQSVALSGGASSSVNNVLAVQVNAGPPAAGGEDVDILFASVTICVPGTANCQTIDNVEVDTGSSGLRLLASQVNIALPQATVGGNPLAECIQFVDTTYGFGSVATADIQMAGEVASSVPIQVLAAPGFTNVPNSCSSGAPADYNLDSVLALGANGLIGVGLFRQDCGQYCNSAPAPSGFYYSCPNALCSPVLVPLTSQLQNPVWMFPQDNNGVLISLPAADPGGDAIINGSLIFGIDTQADNAHGAAQIYTTDANGNFTATYKNIAYSGSFVDSGSNGIFFLDTPQTGLTDCSGQLTGFYCSSSGTPFTVINQGANGVPGQIMFSIVDARTLFSNNNANNFAFSNLGGPFTAPEEFDYGLAFFFGRSVFTGIEGQQTGGVLGPFFAF